jgi:cytochrome b subunit of formate dehydrogenase
MKASSLRKITHWLLLILIIIYIISGLGILYFRIISAITFGLLTKTMSLKIHNNLLIPFLIVLIFHIFLSLRFRKR